MTKPVRRRISVLLAMVCLSLVVVASPAAAQQTASDGDESPVVAMLVPLDGELESMGRQLLESGQLAAGETRLRIEGIDEGETPRETVEAIESLAERDEVVAAVGPIRRSHGPAAAQAALRTGLPLIVYSSADGVHRNSHSVFRGRPSPREQGRRLASYIVDELEYQDVGVIGPRSAYGDELIPAIVEAVDERGGRVAALSRYEEGTTDFRRPLGVLTGSRVYIGTDRRVDGQTSDRWGTISSGREATVGFDALVIADFHDVVARMLPFLPRVDIATGADNDGARVQLLGLSGWRGDGLQMASEHARGAVFFDTFGGASDGTRARQFVIDFRDATGREVTTPEAEVFDIVAMLGDIVDPQADESEPRTRTELVNRLRSPNYSYEGVSGPWQFDADGAVVRQLHPYQVVVGGDWVRSSRGER